MQPSTTVCARAPILLLVALGGCHDSLTAPGRKVDGGADAATCGLAGVFAAVGSMAVARDCHTASLLSSGKVLVAGGATTAEIFDPATATFAAAGPMTAYRCEHTGTVLEDGMVLLAGGRKTLSAELFDPSSGSFVSTGDMSSTAGLSNKPLEERYGHTATRLAGGGADSRWCNGGSITTYTAPAARSHRSGEKRAPKTTLREVSCAETNSAGQSVALERRWRPATSPAGSC